PPEAAGRWSLVRAGTATAALVAPALTGRDALTPTGTELRAHDNKTEPRPLASGSSHGDASPLAANQASLTPTVREATDAPPLDERRPSANPSILTPTVREGTDAPPLDERRPSASPSI